PHIATATSALSLHDALPICRAARVLANNWLDQSGRECDTQYPALAPVTAANVGPFAALLERLDCGAFVIAFAGQSVTARCGAQGDRKSTRLNSSHVAISYAV